MGISDFKKLIEEDCYYKQLSWQKAYEKLVAVIAEEFKYHVSSIKPKILAPYLIKYNDSKQETLEEAAPRALGQAKAKQYAQELKDVGITHILLLGIGCKGKELLVLSDL